MRTVIFTMIVILIEYLQPKYKVVPHGYKYKKANIERNSGDDFTNIDRMLYGD